MLRIIFQPNSNFVPYYRDKVKKNGEHTCYIELELGNDVLMPEDLLDAQYIQVNDKELVHALNCVKKEMNTCKRNTQYFFGQDMLRILSHYISSVAHVESR